MDAFSRNQFRYFTIASIVPLAIMILAMIYKPVWRDEVWSLYFADPTYSIDWLATHRWANEVHPPLYYMMLHFWQQVSSNLFFVRSLSLVFCLLTIFGIHQISAKDDQQKLFVFLLISLGSYWIIYFATEVRQYVLVYCLASITVFSSIQLIRQKQNLGYWIIFVFAGAALGVSHYFGALWTACLGFVIGIANLTRREKTGFFKSGFFTFLALIPALMWISYSFPQMQLSEAIFPKPFFEKFQGGTHQFSRGLLIKTFGSNPIITLMGIGGLIASTRWRKQPNSVLTYAIFLTVICAFILHLFFVELIKERAFIVIMPAVIYLFADHICSSPSKWIKWLPFATAIMPLVFFTEYFKEKERTDELLNKLAEYKIECREAEIGVFYRPSSHPEFYKFATQYIVKGTNRLNSLNLKFVDLEDGPIETSPNCPILGIAIYMPKNDKNLRAEATNKVAANMDPQFSVETIMYGKGRNILWIKRNSSD